MFRRALRYEPVPCLVRMRMNAGGPERWAPVVSPESGCCS